MSSRAALGRACDQIPGLLRGAAVLVPDGVVLAYLGAARETDLEPLVRAALCCVADRPSLGTFVEYVLVSNETILLVEVARTARFVLAAECSHGANLALLMTATRRAAAALEAELDLASWEAS